MSKKKLHKTGDRFGALTVISDVPIRKLTNRNLWWTCRCDCGIERIFKGDKLRAGKSKSCGCLRPPPPVKPKKYTCDFSDEGVRRAFQSWKSMRKRCHSVSAEPKIIRNYQSRGITVCDRWRNGFNAFLSDLGPRPAYRTLGRKDNDKGYSPDNCRWETRSQQDLNRRDTIWVEFQGQRQKLNLLCKRLGLKTSVVHGRLKNGWDIQTALTRPVNHYRKR